jgi:hypothetical protein
VNFDVIRIKVAVEDLWTGEAHQTWLELSRAEFRDAFAPLPRDRELPWAVEECCRAAEQRAARDRAASFIARKLAPAIVESISKVDTINGYSRKEWDQTHS